MYDVIVIGKGPAGITSAIYAKRAGLNILVIGKGIGALEKTDKIENYYGFEKPIEGKKLVEHGINQAKNLGITVIEDEVTGINYEKNFLVKAIKQNYETKTIILATGTNRKSSPIKGIKEFEGKGISYCAVCDAFFYKQKDVAVLGDGDYALSEAFELLPIAKSVTILTNGSKPIETRSTDIKFNPKVIREFRGNNTINEVEFKDNTTLPVAGVFIAEGFATSIDLARKIGAQTIGNQIKVDENMQTTVPGLFAAGDCTGGLLQISKAVYEGTKAGLSAVNYVRIQKAN